ncbi:MAG TPA: hypothetical protein VEQ18_03755, partial [Candidatus Nitrosocosmicus sp.]|nr:hypothetical protein [Candidatus Nitrosocosmicus sp.]
RQGGFLQDRAGFSKTGRVSLGQGGFLQGRAGSHGQGGFPRAGAPGQGGSPWAGSHVRGGSHVPMGVDQRRGGSKSPHSQFPLLFKLELQLSNSPSLSE